jgi:hypothetical protein
MICLDLNLPTAQERSFEEWTKVLHEKVELGAVVAHAHEQSLPILVIARFAGIIRETAYKHLERAARG